MVAEGRRLKPPEAAADSVGMSARPRKPPEPRAWGYSAAYAWRYGVETIPSSMEVRFHALDEAVAAGFCGCECGVCKPGHSHSVDDGCVCSLFGCFCSDHSA
jgi:hypothetical protein